MEKASESRRQRSRVGKRVGFEVQAAADSDQLSAYFWPSGSSGSGYVSFVQVHLN